MTLTDTLTDARDEARALIARWDAQQTGYIRHREARFDTIARVVAARTAEVPAPRILDLAAGPGSLGADVLSAVPHGRLILLDKDPALLALARDAHALDDRVTVVAGDLTGDWAAHPALAEPFDAVVSSTALHWLQPDALVRVYFQLADMIRPGGILLNGDHLLYDEISQPAMRAVAARDDETVQAETFAGGADSWEQWWDAVAASPRYASAFDARESAWGDELHVAPPKVTLGFHRETLRSAGFAETGTVWRYLDDHVVYGIR